MNDDDYFIADWQTCKVCGGDGEVLKYKPQPDDPEFATAHRCDACGGSGWICEQKSARS